MAYISRDDVRALQKSPKSMKAPKKLIGSNVPVQGGRVMPPPLGSYRPVFGGRRGR